MSRQTIRLAAIAAIVLARAALASDEAPLGRVGNHVAPLPHHEKPLPTDKPVVHKLHDLYQLDQKYSDLFSKKGASEICGPTTMGMLMLYLKREHTPRFTRLLEHEGLSAHPSDDELVHRMFEICDTSKSDGTTLVHLKGCAFDVIVKAAYGIQDLFAVGLHSDTKSRKRAVTPEYLRSLVERQGHRSDRAVVLLVGWYDKKTYKRAGGHYTAVAGYDANDKHTFYVTNPLVQYPKGEWYSKVVFEPVPQGKAPMHGMWQSPHFFGEGKHIAVVEDVLALLPSMVASPFARPPVIDFEATAR